MKSGASLNRYKSEQDVRTPRDFLDAIENRFGKIDFDLAATQIHSQLLMMFDDGP